MQHSTQSTLQAFISILLQEKAVSRVGELFEKADINNDGKLTLEELRIMMKDASKEYPHLEEHSRFLEG